MAYLYFYIGQVNVLEAIFGFLLIVAGVAFLMWLRS